MSARDETLLPPTTRRKLLVILLALLPARTTVVLPAAVPDISCHMHQGDFSNEFSPDFDIDSVDCSVPGKKHFPKLRFWAVSPYVGIEW